MIGPRKPSILAKEIFVEKPGADMGAFKDGILQGVEFQKARWTGGKITPEIVVLHDTASRLGKGNAARYLRDNDRRVSVHFVIERDGTLVQQVPVGRRANHAGRSSYHGRAGCNGFSIGVEIVNPGRLTRFSEIEANAWFGETFDIAAHGIQPVATPQHGTGLWMAYTEPQIETVLDLLRRLFDGVPTLRDITTHWYISPGRKMDTNPLFPLEQVRSKVLGREDPVDDLIEAESEGVPVTELVGINVPGDTLNMRRWPSFNPNIIGAIPDSVIVPVVRRGIFGARTWLLVQYAGQEGWILGNYADPVTFKEEGQ